jgi:riboflavin biosynthesis pyrimidine reductase
LPGYDIPSDLGELYGAIGFPARVMYSNFVSSLDGVVALGAEASAGSIISGRNEGDRFLMGLLRACADAVLLGAGTLRATPGHRWTPEHIFPAMAGPFARLRSDLGKAPRPRLVLFSAAGHIPESHPAVIEGATIVTTEKGASTLAGRLSASSEVLTIEKDGRVDVERAVAELRRRGNDVLLTEGGPHLMGDLVRANLLDELFLTVSPVLAGRDSEPRQGMLGGAELLPDRQLWSRLISARRNGDFLFLRYRLTA